MTRTARVVVGALLGTMGCVALAAAQGPLTAPATDWLSFVGFGSGAGALIAWGTQKERVEAHSKRLDKLEDDRVTRPEFETMGQTIRNIEVDIRQVREMLERRQRPRD